MKREIAALQSTEFDVVVVGGGITGACLAHDAALRGLRVALVEKDDFGMSTSAASSKLLHGGIRYLQKLQFGKVRESARERTYFQVIAPHATRCVPFLIPTIGGSLMKGRAALLAGMNLYRLLCFGLNALIKDSAKRIEFGRLYSRRQVLEQVPLLQAVHGLNGAHTLFEVHMNNSERVTLAFVKTAVDHGAVVANYVRVIDFIQQGEQISGVVCRDQLSGREFPVRARIVVNAAGPFLPRINKLLKGAHLRKEPTGFSKGVHLVTRQIEQRFALALSSGKKTEGLVTRGGRHIFLIPWRGRSLIGTTNVPFTGNLDEVRVTNRDIRDFLQDINAIIPGVGLRQDDVHYAFAGLYPLISDEIKTDTYQGTGEYQVVDHAGQHRLAGMVSVLGAKYTTARAIAEQAVDIVVAKLNKPELRCRTATEPLGEGRIDDLETFIAERQERHRALLPAATVRHLVVSHGSAVDQVIAFCRATDGYLEPLADDRETLAGEVAWAVEQEMACTMEDVVFARTGLGTIGHPGEAVLQKVFAIMSGILGWPGERYRQEVALVEQRYRYLDD
jgi:glycerol-3-phosphate dehydrogenase